MHFPFRLPRYFVILTLVWIAATTWKIYPHFRDAMRSDGHVIAFGDYVEDTCGQRVGPSAEVCFTDAIATGRKLVAREQAKSILLIEAPILGYFFLYLPFSLAGAWAGAAMEGLRGRRRKPLYSPSPLPVTDNA